MDVFCRCSDFDRFRLVLGRFAKAAELGETHDQPSPGEYRGRHRHAEILTYPFAGQSCEIAFRDLYRLLVFAAQVVRFREVAAGDNTESQIADALGDLYAAPAGLDRFVELIQV